jgi:hypothetical protein
MGPLKAIIRTALLLRRGLRALMCSLGFQQMAPAASYAVALERYVFARRAYSLTQHKNGQHLERETT